MLIDTRDFGQLEINEKQIIKFPFGLLGFEDQKDFALLDSKQPPFYYLQSLTDENLVFTLLSPEVFKKDYDFNVSDFELSEIGVVDNKQTELLVFCVINLNNQVITANLQGPIVINSASRVGRQCIALNNDYTLRHNIFEEMKKEGDL